MLSRNASSNKWQLLSWLVRYVAGNHRFFKFLSLIWLHINNTITIYLLLLGEIDRLRRLLGDLERERDRRWRGDWERDLERRGDLDLDLDLRGKNRLWEHAQRPFPCLEQNYPRRLGDVLVGDKSHHWCSLASYLDRLCGISGTLFFSASSRSLIYLNFAL